MPSWWTEDVYAAFEAAGRSSALAVRRRLPDALVKTARDIYIRFHGVHRWYRHDYSHEELAVWASRIREAGAYRVWVYFNNDFDGYAIKNAQMLAEILSAR